MVVAAVWVPFTSLLAEAVLPRAMLVSVPMPLPVRAIVVGLLLALLVMVTAPVRVPDAVGVTVTVTVHDAPTARVEQLFVCLKSPVAVIAEIVADVVPELDTVTVCAADELPTIVPAKDRLVGFVLMIGPGATPVPDSGTVLVMPEAVMVRLPVREPATVGVNVTLTVQDELAAMLLPQLFVWLKSPEVVIELTGAAALPLLVTVTACGALDAPVATEPKLTALGLMEIVDPLSGRYGGNVGVKNPHCDGPKMPELPPPSVSTNCVEQL